MSFDPRTTGNFTDFAALTRLRAAARTDKRASTSTVARQFETLFTQMMLKSMRSASLGSGILDSEQSRQYRDLADSQLAMSLSTRGNGLGIAKMLERQLLGHDVKDAATLVAYRLQFAGGPPQQQPAWIDSHVAILRDAVKEYGRGGQAEFARRMGCTAARVGQLLKTKSRASPAAPWPAIGGGKAA